MNQLRIIEITGLLSNHHCFAKKDDEGKISTNLVEDYCQNINVIFGAYKESIESKEVLGCKKDTFSSDIDMDLAVFELNKNPSPKFTPIEFSSKNMSESVVEAVVIHYPKVDANDPALEEKTFIDAELGVRAPYVQYTIENCSTQGKFPKSRWKLDKSLGFSIRHTCDQIDGSSGSALISKDDGLLLGVNWGGIELVPPGKDENTKTNVATSIENVEIFLSGDYQEHKDGIFKTGDEAFNATKTSAKQGGGAIINGCGVVGSSPSTNFVIFMLPLMIIGFRTRKVLNEIYKHNYF